LRSNTFQTCALFGTAYLTPAAAPWGRRRFAPTFSRPCRPWCQPLGHLSNNSCLVQRGIRRPLRGRTLSRRARYSVLRTSPRRLRLGAVVALLRRSVGRAGLGVSHSATSPITCFKKQCSVTTEPRHLKVQNFT